MLKAGIPIEVHHHEVATAGQCEIDMRYGTLVKTANSCLLYKYIVKNIAKQNNMTATFMPNRFLGIMVPECILTSHFGKMVKIFSMIPLVMLYCPILPNIILAVS